MASEWPCDWLGLLIGGKKYIQMTEEDQFSAKLDELVQSIELLTSFEKGVEFVNLGEVSFRK